MFRLALMLIICSVLSAHLTQAGRICDSSDCIVYDLASQPSCTQEQHPATGRAEWYAGLDLTIDSSLLGGRVIAYRILWSNNVWSEWYVPGMNDLDWKFNPRTMYPRRVWSYFSDHTHEYIICRSKVSTTDQSKTAKTGGSASDSYYSS